ncbi:hypothetical protein ACF1G4_03425 [Streptomyces caelestis]
MNAATTAEWWTAAAVGAAGFLPGALLILGLDHDLTPRMPRRPQLDLTPVLEMAERAAAEARWQVAKAQLVISWHLGPTGTGR